MKTKLFLNALLIGLAGIYLVTGLFFVDNYTLKLCLWAVAISHIGLLFPARKHRIPFVIVGLALIIVSQLI